MLRIEHCRCVTCQQRVMVDHRDHNGRPRPIWHTSATAARCPGTDKPAHMAR